MHFFPRAFFGLLIILCEAVGFLILQGHILFGKRNVGKAVGPMPDEKIVFYQLLEKLYGAGAVRERMEHFEINPGFIVIYLKKKGLSVSDIQIQAGRLGFLLYHRLQFTFLKIIPEQAFAHDGQENRIFFHGFIQGRLQGFTFHRLL